MNKKYIFLDIDGTIRDPFFGTPNSAIDAIRKARKNGHLAIVCTGRAMGLIPDDFPKEEFDGFITGGGCHIELNGDIILDKLIPAQSVLNKSILLREDRILHRIETENSVYMEPEMADMLGFLGEKTNNSNSEIKQMIAKRNKFEFRYTIDDFHNSPVNSVKICTISDLPQFETVRKIFGEDYCIISHKDVQNNTVNTEIIQKGCDKGSAIKNFCKAFGVSTEDTIAFGDSMNDIDMFNAVGLTVAMQNGEQKLKEKADIVCGDILEDGLYDGFIKAGIIEK